MLVNTISLLLSEFDLPADALVLDIAEREIANAASQVVPTLLALRSLGCGVALDAAPGDVVLLDLRSLPLSEIKITGEGIIRFTERTQELGVGCVFHRLAYAREAGIPATAIGVETEETLWALQRAGFNRAQGHYICRPLPAHELGRWNSVWHQAAASLTGQKPEDGAQAPPKIEGKAMRVGEANRLEGEPQASAGAPPFDALVEASAPCPSAPCEDALPAAAAATAPQPAPALSGTPVAEVAVRVAKKPAQQAEIAPLIARRLPGLDKPIQMTVGNAGNERFGLLRRLATTRRK
jgi:hypothetical protein